MRDDLRWLDWAQRLQALAQRSWADVGDSPSSAVEREVLEEAVRALPAPRLAGGL